MDNPCRTCGDDISNRHTRALLCFTCRDKKPSEKIPLPEKNCIDCGTSIKQSQSDTVRCHRCLRSLHGGSTISPQRACTTIVGAAIRAGILPRQNTQICVDCGKQAMDYDHRDYMKPLDVDPVCRSCNFKRGPALNRNH